MALKQLMLRKTLEFKRGNLTELTAQEEGLKVRAEEIEAALAEAQTEAELSVVAESADVLEAEQAEHNQKKESLEGEINGIEKEIEELDKKTAGSAKEKSNELGEKRGGNYMRNYYTGMTRAEIKSLKRAGERRDIANMLKREDITEFFAQIREMGLKKRALTNADLLIPEIVLDRIQIIMGDYGGVYNEVDVIRIKGKTRIVFDGANPEAIWIEMCDPVQALSSSFKAVELDGFKVGGYIPVCNALMEDSMINLAIYVTRKLAVAIVKAYDKAIIKGEGKDAKQPLGVITALADENKITLDNNATGGVFGNLFTYLAKIDTGENDVGEIIAVMRRGTYYADVAPRLVIVNSSGTYTVPNIAEPNVAGLRVVFSQNVPLHAALIGDYDKYKLIERAGTQISSSEHVRFIEDQTVFKGTSRADGKPVNLDENDKTHDWILVTFPTTTNP